MIYTIDCPLPQELPGTASYEHQIFFQVDFFWKYAPDWTILPARWGKDGLGAGGINWIGCVVFVYNYILQILILNMKHWKT